MSMAPCCTTLVRRFRPLLVSILWKIYNIFENHAKVDKLTYISILYVCLICCKVFIRPCRSDYQDEEEEEGARRGRQEDRNTRKVDNEEKEEKEDRDKII